MSPMPPNRLFETLPAREGHSTAMGATTLYLVRHGATDANLRVPYILQGRGVDLPLNAVGRRQAAAVSEFLKTRRIDHVYASLLRRSFETAEAIAAPHRHTVRRVEPITECHVGQWEGMDWESIREKHPEACARFHEDPAANPYLGGESYRDVLARVEPAMRLLLQEHPGETIVVVAHNIVNRVFLAHLLGLDLKLAKDLRQANGCVNVIRAERGRVTLETMNSCFHLPPEG